MEKEEILRRANKIVAPFRLKAEILGGINSVGVGGDSRSYTPVINLIGPHPGDDILVNISNRLGNELPINRVTFQIAVKPKNRSKERR